MAWKTPSALLLLLPVSLFLAAAAAPPGDCVPDASAGQTAPIPLDLAGRPSVPTGLAGHTFATLPNSEAGNGCRSPLPSVTQSTTLRSESGDILHGLPAPDILRPIDEPKRAPDFQ
jgi:hypothetical protein